MKSVMIVAAEASSGLFAQRLLEHWQKSNQVVKAFGVGTDAMEKIGFERIGKSEEMAVVGASEIFEHWSVLKATFNRLIEEVKIRKPKVIILMDYPEFNLMLAKKLHHLSIPIVYYISPQVWAWRQGRVKKIKKFCQKILVLFPFEKEFYLKHGVPVEFVGHPVLDELEEKYFEPRYQKLEKERFGVKSGELVLGLMPGSRRGELKRHLELQLKIAGRLVSDFPNLRVMLLLAPTIRRAEVEEQVGAVSFPLTLVREEPFAMISLVDFMLVASGTATLMVGLLLKPMVIMYKMKWLSGYIAKLLVRGVQFFGLVNLIMGREVVPERWQEGANEEELYRLMKNLIENQREREKVISDLKEIQKRLGDKGATRRVATALQEYFL